MTDSVLKGHDIYKEIQKSRFQQELSELPNFTAKKKKMTVPFSLFIFCNEQTKHLDQS